MHDEKARPDGRASTYALFVLKISGSICRNSSCVSTLNRLTVRYFRLSPRFSSTLRLRFALKWIGGIISSFHWHVFQVVITLGAD